MHENEFEINGELVRQLVRSQFPHWSDLMLTPVQSDGTDNAHYRLGTDMLIRLPRIDWAVDDVHKEHVWLPQLSQHLPLPIPQPIAKGQPTSVFPWPWSVYRWITGETARLASIPDPERLIRDLAQFIRAMRTLQIDGLPTAARGETLASREQSTRQAIARLDTLIDVPKALQAWENLRKATSWDETPVLIHGDLKPDNMLIQDGKLKAIIDLGGFGLGDPAVDLLPAWNFFPQRLRSLFRQMLEVDEAVWQRGKGWALSVSAIALDYYKTTNPSLAALSLYTIEQVVHDEAD